MCLTSAPELNLLFKWELHCSFIYFFCCTNSEKHCPSIKCCQHFWVSHYGSVKISIMNPHFKWSDVLIWTLISCYGLPPLYIKFDLLTKSMGILHLTLALTLFKTGQWKIKKNHASLEKCFVYNLFVTVHQILSVYLGSSYSYNRAYSVKQCNKQITKCIVQ